MLIPDENTKDLAEIPTNIKEKLEIKPVKWLDEVLQVALRNMPQPVTTDVVEPPNGEKTRLVAAGEKQRVHRAGKRAH